MSYFNFNAQNGQVNFVSPWRDPGFDNTIDRAFLEAELGLDTRKNSAFSFVFRRGHAQAVSSYILGALPERAQTLLNTCPTERNAQTFVLPPSHAGAAGFFFAWDRGQLAIFGGNGVQVPEYAMSKGAIQQLVDDRVWEHMRRGGQEHGRTLQKLIDTCVGAKDLKYITGVLENCKLIRTSLVLLCGFNIETGQVYLSCVPAISYGNSGEPSHDTNKGVRYVSN